MTLVSGSFNPTHTWVLAADHCDGGCVESPWEEDWRHCCLWWSLTSHPSRPQMGTPMHREGSAPGSAGGRKWVKGAVEEEELLRHIGNASDMGTGSLIDWGWRRWPGWQRPVCLRPLGIGAFCETLELLLNGLDFDLRLFRSEERKGIGKVM